MERIFAAYYCIRMFHNSHQFTRSDMSRIDRRRMDEQTSDHPVKVYNRQDLDLEQSLHNKLMQQPAKHQNGELDVSELAATI